MKVAILHDWLVDFRGGERVLKALCELFPEARIYTLYYQKGTVDPLIESKTIISSFANSFSFLQRNYRKTFPLMPFIVKTLRIDSDTDLVISSSHCVIKSVRVPAQAKHICYFHSPMRFMYDQFDSYFGNDRSFVQRVVAKMIRPFVQNWDSWDNDHIDLMLANSSFVQKRIARYYHRPSTILHPFVNTEEIEAILEKNNVLEKEDYFVMLTAFSPNKKVDIAIKAFNEMGKKLKIIGKGQDEAKLKEMAKENIEFLGALPREEAIITLAKAQGFIFPGVEDFGITPLEAIYCGTPVVAYKEGGILETQDLTTALFFQGKTDEEKVHNLKEKVLSFELEKFDRQKLKERALSFSKKRFQQSFMNHVEELLTPTLR